MNSISKTAAPSKAGCLLELFFWEGGGIFFFKKRSNRNNIERRPRHTPKTSFSFLKEFVLIPKLKSSQMLL